MADQHRISIEDNSQDMTPHDARYRSIDHPNTAQSVVRTHYEDDVDADNHDSRLSREQAPLIASTGPHRAESRSRSHKKQQGQRGHVHTRHQHGEEPPLTPLTWLEWTIHNGIHPSTWTRHTYIKAALLLMLLTLVILAFTVLRVQDHVKDILHYIDDHRSMGAVLFVSFYTIACWLFLPGSLFTIGAGFLFRPMPFALAIVMLGDVLGALGSFLFGRYIFYNWVKSIMAKHPKFGALDQVIQDDGWKIVVMLRLTPIPFNLITYFFSITSIPLYTLLWATAVGVFPGSCLGIWIGSLIKGLSGIDNPELETKNVVILVMNGVFIVCSILTLSIFGKKSMRKAMARLDQHQEQQQQGPLCEQEGAAAEEDEEDVWNADLEAAVTVRHQGPVAPRVNEEGEEQEEEVASSTSVSTLQSPPLVNKSAVTDDEDPQLTGFTRGEKLTFVAIAIVAVVNLAVCIPLYHHFADQDL
ncbi:hypothetical protein BGZ70_009862 [Mortierella alpina]|uniref:VTT domain-containing protein n=1 Tax=Mortierella alpina TaxID=64518 RepID=A0A9P6J0Z4_MORAP|nr:hypothetical protein BGZ70_009862 [Mortierella alpina]